MIYTGRYANKKLNNEKYVCVIISLGSPKWKLSYKLDGEIEALMPKGLFKINEIERFKPLYFKRLNSYGVEFIREKFEELKRDGKDIVLLCFEDINKPENWCHRTVFAEWWEMQTGEKIIELEEMKPIKKKIDVPMFVASSLF